MNIRTKLMVAGIALALAGPVAAADTILFAQSGGLSADHDPGNPVNLGNVFTLTSTARVTSLGFYTPSSLVGGGETVGLYNSGGTLLVSTFVAATPATPGQYVFQSIAPFLLTGGQQYTVVVNTGQNGWAFGGIATSGATFNYNSYAYGPTLAFTTNTGGSGPAYLGPNLSLAAVPEPASWALMLVGFGAVGYGMRGRRLRVVAA